MVLDLPRPNERVFVGVRVDFMCLREPARPIEAVKPILSHMPSKKRRAHNRALFGVQRFLGRKRRISFPTNLREP